MVGKKVPNPDHSASKAVRIEALARYIATPETDNAQEKCLHFAAHGFLTEALDTRIAEMVALAREGRRSRDPIVHYVLSWPRGERPSGEQVEEAIDLLLREMGVAGHQVIYGLHADTDNRHVHVMLNRVDPDTCKVVKINRGFDRRALYRACAQIEHAQGWRAERNAPFRVNAAGEVEDTGRTPEQRAPRPTPRQRDAEHRTGEASAARQAIETASPLIEAAGTWEALHTALAERGFRYARRGSGAVIGVGGVFVKASTVSRKATLARLEKRLGPYVGEAPVRAGRERPGAAQAPAPAAHPSEAKPLIEAARSWQGLHRALAGRGLRYVRKGSGALVIAGEHEAVTTKASAVARSAALRRLEARLGPWEGPAAEEEGPREETMPRGADYAAERARHEAARHGAWAAFEAEREEEERALAERQRKQREALFRKRSWEGLLRALYLQRSLLAAQHAEEKAALEDKRRRERAALRARFSPWPDYPAWVADPALALLWRERTPAPPSLEPESATQATGQAHDIRDYEARAVGHWVLYATRAQHPRGEVAFVDRGQRITLHARDDVEAASLAAMQLAAAKWGRFRVDGREAHKRRCARLAAEHGFALANPELQDLIGQYRRELERQAAARREAQRYGPEAARLAGEIRRIREAHGTARLVFDPPLTADDRSAARQVTAVDAAGARHDLGRHALGTVALAKACARGQAPHRALASRLEARKARHARAAAADAAPSQTAQSRVPHSHDRT